MHSWWMQTTEHAARLELREASVPEPGPRQLLVRVQAAGLNRGEFMPGHGQAGNWKAVGGEAAGEVVRVGTEVTAFRPGDRVMARCPGAFAEFALMEADEAMAVPPCLDWDEAGSLPMAFLVTFDMLVEQGHLKPGEWLLVNGVSSGVGVACLQLGKALGARVIGTSGSQEKLDALKALGLDLGLCTRGVGFADAVMQATGGRGANLAVNTVGGSVFAEDVRALAYEGRLAMVGYVDGQLHADIDLDALHAKRLTLFGVSNRLRSKAQRAASVRRFTAEVLPHVEAGRLKPWIDRVYPFAQLPEAKARMDAGGHVGKIVLRVVLRTE